MRRIPALLGAMILFGGPVAITNRIDLTFNDSVVDADNTPIFDDPTAKTFPTVWLTGTFTTDGTLGALTRANIVTYCLVTTFGSVAQSITPGQNQTIPDFFAQRNILK